MIVLNFKTYPEVTLGEKRLELAKIAETMAQTYSLPIVLCVQATDIYLLSTTVSIPIFAQHIDPIEPGKHTGFLSAAAVKAAGASGVLINHSEHRLDMDVITQTVACAKKETLKTLVCVENATEAIQVDALDVDAIALEDPLLIGGNVSIVDNESGKKQVEAFVAQGLRALALVGAGVKDQADVRASLALKAKGILLASGFVLAQDPRLVLDDLCKGFQ